MSDSSSHGSTPRRGSLAEEGFPGLWWVAARRLAHLRVEATAGGRRAPLRRASCWHERAAGEDRLEEGEREARRRWETTSRQNNTDSRRRGGRSIRRRGGSRHSGHALAPDAGRGTAPPGGSMSRRSFSAPNSSPSSGPATWAPTDREAAPPRGTRREREMESVTPLRTVLPLRKTGGVHERTIRSLRLSPDDLGRSQQRARELRCQGSLHRPRCRAADRCDDRAVCAKMVTLLAYSGLRISRKDVGLISEDVDLVERTIHVRKQLAPCEAARSRSGCSSSRVPRSGTCPCSTRPTRSSWCSLPTSPAGEGFRGRVRLRVHVGDGTPARPRTDREAQC